MNEPFISYAQNGEDIVAWRVLRRIEHGFFVDVGAADPIGYSATYALYLRGWRGVNLEPVSSFANALRTLRPDDVTLEIAAGSRPGRTTLFEAAGTGLSTVIGDQAERMNTLGFGTKQIDVEVRTLNDLLVDYCPSDRQIHLLKIDVEGAEADVLSGLDLSIWRPWVCIVESTKPMSKEQNHAQWESLLLDHNYQFCLFDGLNRYYLACERGDLSQELSYGPSIFDQPYQRADVTLGIERHRENLVDKLSEAQAQVTLLSAQAAAGLSLEELGALRSELGQANAELAHAHSELVRVASERDEVFERAGNDAEEARSVLDETHAELLRVVDARDELDERVSTEADLREQLTRRLSDAELAFDRSCDLVETERLRNADLDAVLTELRHSSSAQIRELYNSETWRIGRLFWHIGRRTGLSFVLRRPVGFALRRIFRAHRVESVAVLEGDSPLSARWDGDLLQDTPAVETYNVPRADLPSAWVFPAVHEWAGGLADFAETLSQGYVASNPELWRQIDELEWNSAETLRSAAFSSDERDALNELCLALQGRTSREALTDVWMVDVRCLQVEGLVNRGVGRHAVTVLASIVSQAGSERELLLVTDPAFPLPRIELSDLMRFLPMNRENVARASPSAFFSLSPSTACVAASLVPSNAEFHSVVYDLIPLSFPRHYFSTAADFVRYVSSLVWLRRCDRLWAISASTADVFASALQIERSRIGVTGVEPASAIHQFELSDIDVDGPVRVLLCGGAEARKNLLSPVRSIASSLGGRRTEIRILGRLVPEMAQELKQVVSSVDCIDVVELLPESDVDVAEAFRQAHVVVVSSHAEGFSLPVAEAVLAGRPVIASAIDAHRELLGDGPWLVQTGDETGWARQIDECLTSRTEWCERQASAFEGAVAARERIVLDSTRRVKRSERSRMTARATRPTVAVITPLPPQRSGVADYSANTLRELDRHFDLTFVTNCASEVSPAVGPTRDQPITTSLVGRADAVLHVIGNSHFHIPALEHLQRFGGAALAHDNRMQNLYHHWRGRRGMLDVLGLNPDSFDDTEADRLLIEIDELPNLGYAEIARDANPMFVHSSLLADRVRSETGVNPIVLPFCPYRLPRESDPPRRRPPGSRLQLASFGEISITFKRHDLMVEMLSWLRLWGHSVHLVFVGGGDQREIEYLEELAESLDVGDLISFTGYLGESEYRTWLTEVDAAVQVRSSALLSLSGAVVDVVAFGIPLVTTVSIRREIVNAPGVFTVPDTFGSYQLACAALEALDRGAEESISDERRAFLAERSAVAYADQLAAALLECMP
jgi:FkbM family methyltransferase